MIKKISAVFDQENVPHFFKKAGTSPVRYPTNVLRHKDFSAT
jgi:hypothetical protein